MISVPIHDALIRPWPNTVYSVSADGMNIGVNGQIRFGDGGAFALKVAAAVVKMWSATDNRPLMVELNSGGGDIGAAQMMAYSLLLANRLTRQGTATAVGRESACYSACTFLFAAGSYRKVDPSALFMFHQPHSQTMSWQPKIAPEDDDAKFQDRLTGLTLSWVSFRSPELAAFLEHNGFYRSRDCFLSAIQIGRDFPRYLTGKPAPLQIAVSPPLGFALNRDTVDSPEANGCFKRPE